MMENLEMRLLEQLKYKEGLDTQKLSELVKLATKLFEGIAKPQAKAAKTKFCVVVDDTWYS